MTGQKLGSYELLDKLGEGGMGQVWRARDARLDRMVALKLLPADVADDGARRQRFEQEARSLAALNHPNIVAIYDVGEGYIVSELVDGESLRDLLEGAPLPQRRVMDITVQTAEALAAAHALGIVHRDLKPENIMITRDQRVKVLDFGLAKRTFGEMGDKTATMALSQPGVVLGTAGYMSPEQVRGQSVDHRSDIFSFGCVLQEMATGKRAFDGASSADVMSAILKEEPSEATGLPPALGAIVRRCLEKNPAQRFQSAADLAFALRSMTTPSGTVPTVSAAPRRIWIWPASAAAAIALFAAGYFLHFTRSDAPRFHRLTFREGRVNNARFSGNGENVVYEAAWDGGPNRIFLGTPDNAEARDLDMPVGSRLLSVSSKGDLAFTVGPFQQWGSGTLARNSVAGGQARELLENVTVADWSPDGSELAVVRHANGKERLEYPIGKVLTESDGPIFSIRISPSGSAVAFASLVDTGRIGISVAERKGGVRLLGVVSNQISTTDAAPLAWRHDGKEIYFHSFDTFDWETIHAIGIDGKRRVVARFPGRVILFDIAADGRMLLSTEAGRAGILGQAPGETTERDLSCLESSYLRGISDDGRLIVATLDGESGGTKGSIYLHRTDGSPCVRLGDGIAYRLSPDGKWISGYTSKETARRKSVLIPTGPGEPFDVSPGDSGAVVAGWLAGDQNYLLAGTSPGKRWQLFAWNAPAKSVKPLTPEGMDGAFPLVSPDKDKFLAKGSDQLWRIYFVAGGDSKPVTGLTPHDTPINWTADGRSLYIATHHDENKTIPVSILDTATGKRTPWKEIRPAMPVDEAGPFVRITPDGRSYAYNFHVRRSELYLAEGIR